jgi:uncharacterized phiE125 gp8 family phage protein
MAWADEILEANLNGSSGRGTNFSLDLGTDSAVEPVSIEDLQSHLYLSRATAAQLEDLTFFGIAARQHIEKQTNKAMIQQTWIQYYDRVHATRGLPLHKGPYPAIGIASIAYQANWDTDTWTTWASSNYTLVKGREVHARSSWPSHRGKGSIRVTFNVGYAALDLSGDDAADVTAIAAARAAIPAVLVKSVKDLAGFYFEHREGQGVEPRYEIVAKTQTSLPSSVVSVIELYRDRRFLT